MRAGYETAEVYAFDWRYPQFLTDVNHTIDDTGHVRPLPKRQAWSRLRKVLRGLDPARPS